MHTTQDEAAGDDSFAGFAMRRGLASTERPDYCFAPLMQACWTDRSRWSRRSRRACLPRRALQSDRSFRPPPSAQRT